MIQNPTVQEAILKLNEVRDELPEGRDAMVAFNKMIDVHDEAIIGILSQDEVIAILSQSGKVEQALARVTGFHIGVMSARMELGLDPLTKERVNGDG